MLLKMSYKIKGLLKFILKLMVKVMNNIFVSHE